MITSIPNPIRRIYDDLGSLLKKNKVIVITGPRRSGKTTLIKRYLPVCPYRYRLETGDNITLHAILGSQKLEILKDFVDHYQLIVVDEAHLIPNLAINLKLMVDNIPNIRLLVTGSGSFDLLQKIGEPLVGRKYTYQLFPISVYELKKNLSVFDLSTRLEKFLIYGMYPDVLTATTKHERRQNLKEIAESYLFKDLLIFEGLKNSAKLLKLLKLLAFQIGSEVSLTELGNSLDIDKKTVARYLDLLEKTYIITPLTPYFINRRQSVIKKHKYYFLDTGIRNALIDDLRPLNTRTDIGQLWENFLVVERLKKQAYTPIYGSNYFWRTWAGQEIDWVEMRDGKLYGFEFKWGLPTPNPNKSSWLKAYPKEASYQLVNQKNYLDFIT